MTEQQRVYQEWQDTELTYAEALQARQGEELDTARQILNGIDKTLKERGSLYGSFEAQARCVGEIINSVEFMAKMNNQEMDCIMRGCVAYMAVKLARFGLNPKGDTSHDLHGYAKLIDELYNGEK